MNENSNKNGQINNTFVEPEPSYTSLQKIVYECIVHGGFPTIFVVDQINQNLPKEQKLEYSDFDGKKLYEDIRKLKNLSNEEEITLENMPDDKSIIKCCSNLSKEKNKEQGNKDKLNKVKKSKNKSALEIAKGKKESETKKQNKGVR